ncbi:GTPase [Paludisphaera mucosa]|uniref:50S ribosome-binding GTPase n=1 Tax=Paludisphaera mucosa TaxID=3030827 RepID=A0ABT6FBI6_9BACT|nr:GTPase [Paludisphaera mucosa]MDG3004871.1 50S ribosome-binding GTPase [Paludisphaera mucosa]
MEYSTWSRRVVDLAAALSRLESEAEAAGVPPSADDAWHANLYQKLVPQASDAPYLIVAVAGGANMGKSTLFNHLVGFPASRVHHNAAETKHPVAMLPRGFADRHDLARVFPGFTLQPWTSEDDAVAEGVADGLVYREDPSGGQPANLVLLDTPDVDAALPNNWKLAEAITHAADVVVALLTQQKYNDEKIRRFFRIAAEADKAVLAVVNMVEWPEDRDHCRGWLDTFRKGTGASPLHAYAVPRDRVAARDNRLTFHPLSPRATDPRADLAELQFADIKIRSLRGALRQALDPDEGIPAYLRDLERKADENRQARAVIHQKVQVKIDLPRPPGHIVGDEIWRWLEPRRTWFDRKVHGAYGALGRTVAKWLPGAVEPAEDEARFLAEEKTQLNRALETIYNDLEQVHRVGAPALRRELQPLIAGDQRRRAFDELQRRLDAAPLATESYRRVIAGRLESFEGQHPRTMRAIEWGLVATAIARPALTIGMFGAADIAAGPLFNVGAHSIGQVFFDVAAGSALTAGGEGAFARMSGPARALIGDLFAAFYRERAALLARVIDDCVVGRHLDRIERLADLGAGPDFQAAYKLAAELSRELAAFDEPAALATARGG